MNKWTNEWMNDWINKRLIEQEYEIVLVIPLIPFNPNCRKKVFVCGAMWKNNKKKYKKKYDEYAICIPVRRIGIFAACRQFLASCGNTALNKK